MKKIYAFIDSQNLNLGIINQGWKLDFKKFRGYLKDKYRVERASLFIGFMEKNKNLYDFLRMAGYKLIFKPTVKCSLANKTKHLKGNVDAELVLHSMIEYNNYQQAIIISGDGDFHCLLKYLYEKNKLAGVIVPDQQNYSSLLRQFMPKINFMNTLREKLEYKKPHQPHG